MPLLIEFERDDADEVPPLYADLILKQGGAAQSTLTNEDQPIPILVTLVIDFRDGTATFRFDRKECPMAAPVMLQLLKLRESLNTPGCVRLTSLETGMSFGTMRIEADQPATVHPESLALLADLSAAQDRLQRPICIPTEPFTEADLRAIGLIRTILRHPQIEGDWTDAVVRCYARDVEDVLTDFATRDGPVQRMEERTVQLFGEELSLGRVVEIYESITLADEEDVRKQAAAATSEDSEIMIKLRPGSSSRMTRVFLDWLPDRPAEDAAGQEGDHAPG